jgi:SAM-dependent methyltransferase
MYDLLNNLVKPWAEWDKGPPIPYVEKEFLSRNEKSCGLVLDLGCGNGKGMARFKGYGWEAVGIDVFLPEQRHMDIGAIAKTSGEFLAFRDEVFDVILLAQVLHHIPHPRLVLSEVHRCLKKDGLMLFGENTEDNYLLRLSRALYPSHDGMDELSDYSHFRKVDLQDLIQDSGFKILNEATGIILWVPWYELAKRLPVLRPLSFFVKKLDNNLETIFPNSHAQYYCLCAKNDSLHS